VRKTWSVQRDISFRPRRRGIQGWGKVMAEGGRARGRGRVAKGKSRKMMMVWRDEPFWTRGEMISASGHSLAE
jgi:hypothetical protein